MGLRNGLKGNRKGMFAVIDALFFLCLMSLVVTGLFAYLSVTEQNESTAKTVSDDLFSMNVRTCDLSGTEDTNIHPIEVLIAAGINGGRGGMVKDFLYGILNDMIPLSAGFSLELEYNGVTLRVDRWSDRPMSSEFETEHSISGAGKLRSKMTLY